MLTEGFKSVLLLSAKLRMISDVKAGGCPNQAAILPDGRFKANLDEQLATAQVIQILHCERDSQCPNTQKCCGVKGVWGPSTICVSPVTTSKRH